MATKKQMKETINRVDIIEDNLGLLKEMITMQNKHIDSIMQLIIKNEITNTNNKNVQEDVIKIEKENSVSSSSDNDVSSTQNKKTIGGYARRII